MTELNPVGYLYGEPIYFPTIRQIINAAFCVDNSAKLSEEQRELMLFLRKATCLELDHIFKEFDEFMGFI